MKILMICTEKLPVPPVLGGAIQTYISGILPHLSKAHDITVLGINDPSLPDQETIDGNHYVRVPGKIFEVYREEVINYLEANHFDLIHIFNRPRLVLPVRKAAPNSKITLSMHNDMFNPEKINPEEAKAAIDEVTNIVTVSDYIGNVIKVYIHKLHQRFAQSILVLTPIGFCPAVTRKCKKFVMNYAKQTVLKTKRSYYLQEDFQVIKESIG